MRRGRPRARCYPWEGDSRRFMKAPCFLGEFGCISSQGRVALVMSFAWGLCAGVRNGGTMSLGSCSSDGVSCMLIYGEGSVDT